MQRFGSSVLGQFDSRARRCQLKTNTAIRQLYLLIQTYTSLGTTSI